MDEMEELQMTCFEIIGYVGTAKSCYINAIAKAKEGAFDEAEALIKEGDEAYNGGHDVHMKLLQADAAGERNGEAPPHPAARRGPDGRHRDLQAHGTQLHRHLS